MKIHNSVNASVCLCEIQTLQTLEIVLYGLFFLLFEGYTNNDNELYGCWKGAKEKAQNNNKYKANEKENCFSYNRKTTLSQLVIQPASEPSCDPIALET